VAGLAARFGGFLLDTAVVALLFVALAALDRSEGTATWEVVVRLLLTGLYVVPAIGVWGATLGQRIVGLRVVRLDTGGDPGWTRSLVRWAVVAVPGLVSLVVPVVDPFVGFWGFAVYLAIFVDGDLHRGLHDRFSGLLVIEARNRSSR
jgi:uncharacterized RDD family membrane protein YckC